MTILDEILAHKREEVAEAKRRRDANELGEAARMLAERPRGFTRSLQTTPGVAVTIASALGFTSTGPRTWTTSGECT